MKIRQAQLPKDWEIKTLAEVASFSQGIQVGLEKHLKEPQEGYVRFIRIVDYTQNTEDIRYIPNPGDKYFVNEEDIVMVRYGTPGLIGRGKAGVIANNLFRIKIERKDLTNDYLSLFLSQDHIQRYLSTQGSATMPALNFGQLRTVEVIIPPLPEQQRIVSLLDRAFAAIDQAKANYERCLSLSKVLFESYLQGVFEKKGDDWEELKLKEIGLTQTGNTPKTSEKENYGDYISFIKPADVDFSGVGDLRYDNNGLSEIGFRKARSMKNGSTLMVCIGATIGKVGFAEQDVTSNQQINSLTVSDGYFPKFFYYAMTSRVFQEKVLSAGKGAQATLPIINKSKWESLTIAFPKLKSKQESYSKRFDVLRTETQKLETIYQKKIDDLEELKKSILQKAFQGELEIGVAVESET
jgi:type I restriction enzyme S subunit